MTSKHLRTGPVTVRFPEIVSVEQVYKIHDKAVQAFGRSASYQIASGFVLYGLEEKPTIGKPGSTLLGWPVV